MKMKKMRGFGAKAMAVVAAMAMSAATATAAFAWGTDGEGNPTTGASNEQIVIGKSIKMPKNWEPTELSVTFKVTPVGFAVGKETTYTAVDGLSFENGKVTLSKDDFKSKDTTEDQVKYWGAETKNLVSSIKYGDKTGIEAIEAIATEKQSTGSLKFTVTESGFTYTDNSNTFSVSSDASYDLVFWIDYKANDDGTGSYKVTSVTDTKTKTDNGSDVNEKVDPTPESTDVSKTTYDNNDKIVPDTEAGEVDYDLSGMLFNNDITKSDKPENPDTPTVDDNAFKLSKINKDGDENQEFQFTVKLTAPNLAKVDTTQTINVKVYDKNNNEVKDKATTFEYGKDNTIKLKGGETAVFDQMYNSTKVVVTEAGTPSYLPSYASTYGNSSTKTVNIGDSLGVEGITKAKTDYVTYTNIYQSITPTGVIMNNLPFFMMILIGAVAIAAGFVFQARKKVTGR